jgi:hypothetical protein
MVGQFANESDLGYMALLTISNSTFMGNTAISSGNGGAILNAHSSLYLGNSTIVGNTAGTGGGLSLIAFTTAYLGSNLIINNIGGGISSDIYGPETSLGHNVVGIINDSDFLLGQNNDIVGWKNLYPPLDGLVNTPTNNGGPTQTGSLKPGSPAIGHGFCAWTNGSGLPAVTADQRGVARQSPCDVGAYESNMIPVLPGLVPDALVGANYSQTLTSARGDGNYTFSLSSGALPAGMTLSSAGVISGTPSTGGYVTFSVCVSDTSGHTNSAPYILNVDMPTPTPSMTSTATSTSTVTATPTQTLTPTSTLTTTVTATVTITATLTNTATSTATTTPIVHPKDTIGIFRPSTNTFYLRNTNTTGYADITATFNPAAKPYPVVGDWNGDGLDTIGIYDQNTGVFYLRDTNTAGAPNYTFTLGTPGDIPLSGRWFKTATHTGVGVFRPSNGLIYLRNTLTTGYADDTMVLGIPGDVGLAGDWSGQGFDTPGVYRPSNTTFYLSHKTSGTVYADYTLIFGVSGDVPLAGDWVGQGHDGVGIFRPTNGNVYLRNTLTTGVADNMFFFGMAGDMPVSGHWSSASGTASNLIVSPTFAAPTFNPPSFDG